MNMSFRDYWKALSPAEKQALARGANTHPVYLSQIANGTNGRRAGAALIERLMAADPRITFEMMRARDAA